MTVFVDNTTAVAYLRKQGGTRSPVLNSIAQRILHWAESLQIILAPPFIMGKNIVLADSLSRPNQVQGSEWTEVGSVSGPSQEVAGDDRPGCNLVTSLLFTLFFAL